MCLFVWIVLLSATFIRQTASDMKDFSGYRVYQIDVTSKLQWNELLKLTKDHKIDIWRAQTSSGSTQLCVSPEQTKILTDFFRKHNMREKITIPDVQKLIDEEAAATRTKQQVVGGMSWDTYYSYGNTARCPKCDHPLDFEEETFNFKQFSLTDFAEYAINYIISWMDKINKQYPQVTTLKSIGKSHHGRDIMLMEITSSASNISKEGVFIDAGIHAREWPTTTTATYIINELTQNQSHYTEILDNYTFYIVPIVNPDGYEHTQTTNRLWRKNLAPTSNRQCTGVDLNRNFPFKWGFLPDGSSPCEPDYRGPSPCSELECKALTGFVLNHNDITTYITLHTYGRYWMYPFSFERRMPPNHEELHRISSSATLAIEAVYRQPYTFGSTGYVFEYFAAGVAHDWAYASAKINYSYVLELRGTPETGFLLPVDQIFPNARETWEGIQVAVTRTLINGTHIDSLGVYTLTNVPIIYLGSIISRMNMVWTAKLWPPVPKILESTILCRPWSSPTRRYSIATPLTLKWHVT